MTQRRIPVGPKRRAVVGSACIAAVAVVVATAALAATTRYAIHGDARLDALKTRTEAQLGDVEAIFGAPSSIRRLDDWTCRLVWPNRGLAILLFTLDRQGYPCESGTFARGTTVGHAWHTDAGLKIGDPVAKLQELYPNARWHARVGVNSGWWLVTRRDCKSNGSKPFPGLLVRTLRRRVAAFVVQIALCP
jgi:hypothetical protein